MNSYTFTATMYENRNTTSSSATNYRYRLEEAIADPNMSKYVDLIPRASSITAENTAGRAIVETRNWYGATYTITNSADYPIITRDSLFGVSSVQQRQLRCWSGAFLSFIQANNMELG